MRKQDKILGIHHITAMTSNAKKNYEFFTNILGMRLVKKTINQDDIHAYHTYFADDYGTPGTTMTFFDFPNNPKGMKGTNSITVSGFRVPNDKALDYYVNRFNEFNVKHSDIKEEFGVKSLSFWDDDGQAYQLVSDETVTGMAPGVPWSKGPIPTEFAIYGLGTTEISVSYFDQFKSVLETLFDFEEIASNGNRHLMEVGEKGNGARIILVDDSTSNDARQGYGEVHHLAFRLKNRESLNIWKETFDQLGLPNSGYVNRFYFESLYVRIGHILIELATDEPGFMEDEPYETLGESLSLPPFLEHKRAYIEGVIKPFNTKR